MGTNKHPPLSGVPAAWFYDWFGNAGIYILSQVCVLLGFIYIYKLAKCFLEEKSGADISFAQILLIPREANSLIYLIFSLGTLQVSAKKRGCIKNATFLILVMLNSQFPSYFFNYGYHLDEWRIETIFSAKHIFVWHVTK